MDLTMHTEDYERLMEEAYLEREAEERERAERSAAIRRQAKSALDRGELSLAERLLREAEEGWR